jgi:hypothetical protein
MKIAVAGTAARMFAERPEKIATYWRQLMDTLPPKPRPLYLLDAVVEPFTREVGRALLGEPGSPWSRTNGVLRLSTTRGTRALHEEFSALGRCFADALEALGAPLEERRKVAHHLHEAQDAAVALAVGLWNASAPRPRVPFGGVTIEVYEPEKRGASPDPQPSSPLH